MAGVHQTTGGGGGGGEQMIQFAGQPLTTACPALEILGSTAKYEGWAFDDTTEEYLYDQFQVPNNLDTAGTVTFTAYVMAKTAAASKNVALTFGHRPLGDSEAVDGAYTDEDTGDVAIDATQGDQTKITWTETVANLGWAAGDQLLCRLSRYAAGANNLSGDMYLIGFSVRIPTE